MEKYYCEICKKEMSDYIPEYCCAGLSNDCYCMGQPINGPQVCSEECFEKWEIENKKFHEEMKNKKPIPFKFSDYARKV